MQSFAAFVEKVDAIVVGTSLTKYFHSPIQVLSAMLFLIIYFVLSLQAFNLSTLSNSLKRGVIRVLSSLAESKNLTKINLEEGRI